MTSSTTQGPRLSDERFFSEIVDTTRPGLSGIPAAVAAGNWAEARRLLAAEVRQSLQPARFLTTKRQFLSSNIAYPNETLAEAAERILRLELISCGVPHQFEGEVDWFSNHTHNQYREWTWQLSRHPEWAILGEQYRRTGDERYAEGFVRLFVSWVRQALQPEDHPYKPVGLDAQSAPYDPSMVCWRTIEAGIRMGGAWPWALHCFYSSPHFTDDVLVDWYKSVWEHGWWLRHFHRTHNWLIMEMNGLAQIALLYPQFRAAAGWREYAFARLVEELESQVYPDGFQFELTTNYHQVVIRNYQTLWDVYAAYDEPVPPIFGPVLEKMHTVNVRLMMPDGRLPDLNDGGWLPVAPLMERAVQIYPNRADFQWAYSGGKTGAPPTEASWAFANAGYYVMRSGWDSQAIWALFDGGPFGFSHQHEDKLNLMVAAYGRLLLTEAGDYAYDDSEMRRYVLSTRAHNTIRVDGQDQNRRANYDRDQLDLQALAGADWLSTDSYDMVAALYDEGYGPQADTAVSHHRRVIFLKQPPAGLDPCFVVIDRLEAKDNEAHGYETLWHFNTVTATRLSVTTVQSQDAGQSNLTVIAAARPGLEVSVIEGQEEPEWQGWKSTQHNAQGGNVPAPTAAYQLSARDSVRLVWLLYPTPPGQDCPVEAVEAETPLDHTTIRLVLVDGETIDLDEGDFLATS